MLNMNKEEIKQDSYDTTMYFEGYGDDGKIDTDGFFSYVKRISLAGFTKCYNQVKQAAQSAAPTIQIS